MIDFLAGVCELIGLWKIGSRLRSGFIWCIICNILWILYCLLSKSTYGLLLVVIPAFFINIRNLIKWSLKT